MEHQNNEDMEAKDKHTMNPAMGMTGHDHHKMMIADFKIRFFVGMYPL